jgi:hypothetical protein
MISEKVIYSIEVNLFLVIVEIIPKLSKYIPSNSADYQINWLNSLTYWEMSMIIVEDACDK